MTTVKKTANKRVTPKKEQTEEPTEVTRDFFRSLSLDELIVLEDVTGRNFEDMEGVSQVKLGKAMTLIGLQRENPDATEKDAGCLSLEEADDLVKKLLNSGKD